MCWAVGCVSLDRLNGKIRTAETLLYKAQRDIGSEATNSEVKAVGSLLNGLGIKVNERTCFLRRQSTFTEGVAATWYPKK